MQRNQTDKEHVSELTKPVFLIGFMGAGKSSVARKLARMCGVASVDMDKYIERKAGRSIPDIFSDVGEKGFARSKRKCSANLPMTAIICSSRAEVA